MKVVVYVLAYDEESHAAAKREYADKPWARVATLPDALPESKYMEGAAFLKLLADRRAEWADAEFVGTVSWKASTKIDIPPNFLRVCEDVRHADVVALMPSTEHLLKQAMRCHPRFLETWVPLLEKMGYRAQDAVSIDVPCFVCNYFLMKPATMDAFIEFYRRAVAVMETDPELQGSLWADSGYGTHLSADRLTRLYGKPYIPYHPFIGERLACFFTFTSKLALAMLPLGRGSHWEKHYEWELRDVQARADHFAQTLGFR